MPITANAANSPKNRRAVLRPSIKTSLEFLFFRFLVLLAPSQGQRRPMSSALGPWSRCQGVARSKGGAFDLAISGSRSALKPLAVKFQTVDDLVDHLALGPHRQADQIEF